MSLAWPASWACTWAAGGCVTSSDTARLACSIIHHAFLKRINRIGLVCGSSTACGPVPPARAAGLVTPARAVGFVALARAAGLVAPARAADLPLLPVRPVTSEPASDFASSLLANGQVPSGQSGFDIFWACVVCRGPGSLFCGFALRALCVPKSDMNRRAAALIGFHARANGHVRRCSVLECLPV
jgi:hypothetical protein